jgi:hypothetical protein
MEIANCKLGIANLQFAFFNLQFPKPNPEILSGPGVASNPGRTRAVGAWISG